MVDVLGRELGDDLLEHVMDRGDLWVRVSNRAWHQAVDVCRRQLDCSFFSFLAGMDWLPVSSSGEKIFSGEEAGDDDESEEGEAVVEDVPTEMTTGVAGGESRFQVLARLQDVSAGVGITLKADLDEHEPTIASISDLYRGADWHEREAWEFYGFNFDGHPGLRHLYLPGEFEGNPGRKDFPLLARELKPWPGLVNVEQIPDHLDPKKIAAAAAEAAAAAAPPETADESAPPEAAVEEADVTGAPGADPVPAEQAIEAQADLPVTAEAAVSQIAPEAANEVAGEPLETTQTDAASTATQTDAAPTELSAEGEGGDES